MKYRTFRRAEQHPPCARACASLDPTDFASYREAFERCVVEVGILSGKLGEIRPVKILDERDHSDFARAMGIDECWLNRIETAQGFLASYEKLGREQFLHHEVQDSDLYKEALAAHKEAGGCEHMLLLKAFCQAIIRDLKAAPRFSTRLFLDLVRGDEPDRAFRAAYAVRIQGFLDMFDNMKAAGGLVPASKCAADNEREWSPRDYPWAIDYFGYVKKRDGSHRRAIMHYLGSDAIDTLVVSVGKVEVAHVKALAPSLADGYDRFVSEVRRRHEEVSR